MTNIHHAELADAIRKAVAGIENKNFPIDPIMPTNSSLAVSRVSSAYKRHGYILEKAMISIININSNHLEAWGDKIIVPGWDKTKGMQVDLFTYDHVKRIIQAFELKRGGGQQDSGAVRTIKKRFKHLKPHLLNYAKEKGKVAISSDTLAISFYGELGNISPHRVLNRSDLDEHFGCRIIEFLDKVDSYYKFCLHRVVVENFSGSLEEFGITLGDQTLNDVTEKANQRHPWDEL